MPTLLADKVSGLVLAYSIIAALFHRARTGEGQQVEVPMADAMLAFLLVEHGSGAISRPARGPAGYQRILTPLRRLITGRVTIIISHHLATTTDVDHILYLDHGRIIETGTHAQLLARNGAYAHLYRTHHPTNPDRLPQTATTAANGTPTGS